MVAYQKTSWGPNRFGYPGGPGPLLGKMDQSVSFFPVVPLSSLTGEMTQIKFQVLV